MKIGGATLIKFQPSLWRPCYQNDLNIFSAIGIFDVLGYETFHNSRELVSIVSKHVKKQESIKFSNVNPLCEIKT